MNVDLTLSPRIRKTPFHDSVVRAGVATFTVYNKMMLPLTFGDLAGEYQRLKTGVTIWDVSCERQVEISGPDADACVQYLTARDLSKMVVGQGKYVAMCDHRGRLINDPVLLKLDGRYWFSIADSDVLMWARAVAAERGFDVEVCEPDASPLAIQGPKATDLVAELFGDWVRGLKYFWFAETELDGIPVVVCRSGWSKQGGFELFLQDSSRGNELWDQVWAAGEAYGIGPAAPNHVERVESGLLSYGGDNTPDSNPFECGLAKYVDTECEVDYIGKSALQQIRTEGPQRLLVGLILEDPTNGTTGADAWPLDERTTVLQEGQPVGTMSAIVDSPALGKTIAIAQIASTTVAAGQPVTVESPTGTRQATITELPFL